MAIGKVIKNEGGPEPLADRDRLGLGRPRDRVVNAEEFEASQQAKTIIADAQRKAQQIIEETERQKVLELAQAREQGRQQGLAQVSEELMRAKMQAGEIMKEQSQDLLKLALSIAEKIIGADVERDPRVMAQICATAVESLRNIKAMVIRLNPVNAARLRGTNIFAELSGRATDVIFKDDPDVPPAGCIIETEFGTFDAQLHTQLDMLRTVLLPDSGKREGPA